MRLANRQYWEILEGAREMLTPDTWIKGMFAANKSGRDVDPHDSEACQWCMEGAMLAYAYEHITPRITLDTLLPITTHDVIWEGSTCDTMAAFNDEDNTDFDKVASMLNMLAWEFYSLVEQEEDDAEQV